MATSTIIELLAKQSTARLDEMEAELHQQARRVSFELEQVREAKALKQGNPFVRRHAEQHSTSDDLEPVQPPDHPRRRHSNGRSNKSEHIRRIMRVDPDREWRAPEMSEKLREEGIAMSRDAARVAMNRMDDLEKLPGGAFKLARQNGFHTTSPVEVAASRGDKREMSLTDGSRQGVGSA